MELDKFTKEELDELFEASFKVKEIMERYDNWRNLILDNQIYRHNFLLVQLVMGEWKKRKYQHNHSKRILTFTTIRLMQNQP